MVFTGDSNIFDWAIGATGSADSLDLDLTVTGDSNTWDFDLGGAATAESLNYDLVLIGGTNVFNTDIDYDNVSTNLVDYSEAYYARWNYGSSKKYQHSQAYGRKTPYVT